VQFPTGGNFGNKEARERSLSFQRGQQIRFDSGADSIVWMEEDRPFKAHRAADLLLQATRPLRISTAEAMPLPAHDIF